MKARLFLIAGRYEDALTAFRELIASSPNDENWKARLVALPVHQSYIWEHLLSQQAQARSNVAACYRLAAELGNSAAQYSFAIMCLCGEGVEQTPFQAYVWLHLASEAGDARAAVARDEVRDLLTNNTLFKLDPRRPSALAQAKHNIGDAYYHGTGTTQDYTEALKWFKEAAEMGLADSRYNLGLMYKNGQGANRDLVQAYFWLNLAALQGDNEAAAARDSVAATMTAAQLAAAAAMIHDRPMAE